MNKEELDNLVADTPTCCIPQLLIPYTFVDVSKENVVPRQIDDCLFRLRTPIDLQMNVKQTVMLRTGLKLQLPQYIDVSRCEPLPVGVSANTFPRMCVHGHVDSIFELAVEHGLVALGPRNLSGRIANDRELVICLQNTGKKLFVAKAGDEVAEFSLTISPLSTMQLQNNFV